MSVSSLNSLLKARMIRDTCINILKQLKERSAVMVIADRCERVSEREREREEDSCI